MAEPWARQTLEAQTCRSKLGVQNGSHAWRLFRMLDRSRLAPAISALDGKKASTCQLDWTRDVSSHSAADWRNTVRRPTHTADPPSPRALLARPEPAVETTSLHEEARVPASPRWWSCPAPGPTSIRSHRLPSNLCAGKPSSPRRAPHQIPALSVPAGPGAASADGVVDGSRRTTCDRPAGHGPPVAQSRSSTVCTTGKPAWF